MPLSYAYTSGQPPCSWRMADIAAASLPSRLTLTAIARSKSERAPGGNLHVDDALTCAQAIGRIRLIPQRLSPAMMNVVGKPSGVALDSCIS
jgi:hypothetical protein